MSPVPEANAGFLRTRTISTHQRLISCDLRALKKSRGTTARHLSLGDSEQFQVRGIQVETTAEKQRWKRLTLLVFVFSGVAFAALASNAVPRARADVVAELRFAGNLNSCLEVWGGPAATHDGAEAAIWSCWGGSNQKVRVEDAGGGYHRIVFAHSNKCLEVPGWSPEWGLRLGQWSCHGGDNQKVVRNIQQRRL